ncbi:MAG: lytic transglycosylase domain-containing protein [Bdellovibrionales bacterium]|nr:lytic transglycosylase domain-containing protein [Bdellovibrionales bacterium]
MKTYILILLTFTVQSLAFAKIDISRSLASIKRVGHARELLGKRYKKSIVSTFEKHEHIEKNILETITKRLPKKFKSQAKAVTEAIFTESRKHGMDPYFVMAVISGESSFNPIAVGPVGEIGMMQIRPSTGKWMAGKIKFKWKGDDTLRDPVANIKLGTAYLAWLREKFDNHGQLYLAAYNMGPKSVKNALGKNVWPKDYPRHVMKRYLAFYKSI